MARCSRSERDGELRFDGGDQAVQEVALELAERGGLLGFEGVADCAVVGHRAAVGQHDNHGHGVPVGDEVVEDDGRGGEA
jgi:hypothetical protein